MTQTTNSPFQFLDAYGQADADVFFGREKETLGLYQALSGVKHLLVYGPSGVGKTSLVECGLRNQFSDADWFALTIRRGSNINASVLAAINAALTDKLKMDARSEFGPAVEQLFAERYQPVYLLFDQFEELLILGETEEKQLFFTLLNKLIRHKLPCRILLIMREEFIGHLSEFEPLCPSIFQHRYRVEPMGRSTVEAVMEQLLQAPRYRAHFTVANSVQLAQAILAKLPDKKKQIELAHVQVFLGELWERAQVGLPAAALPIFRSDLVKEADNLEKVLESFLQKQLQELEVDFGDKVPLELLATLITERFTKLQLGEADIAKELAEKTVQPQRPLAQLLLQLEKRRILRSLRAGEEVQYEISHDVLALVVGQNLTEAMRQREKAAQIYKLYQERQGLFSQDDMDYLRGFQQYWSLPPVLEQRIVESKAALEQQQTEQLRKTRRRVQQLTTFLAAAILAFGVAIYFYQDARAQQKEANRQTVIAEAETRKTTAALTSYKKEQAARESMAFETLQGQANAILEGDFCPAPILRQMDSLFALHYFEKTSDSLRWKQVIDNIKVKSKNCR
jgi:hypothetical protein